MVEPAEDQLLGLSVWKRDITHHILSMQGNQPGLCMATKRDQAKRAKQLTTGTWNTTTHEVVSKESSWDTRVYE